MNNNSIRSGENKSGDANRKEDTMNNMDQNSKSNKSGGKDAYRNDQNRGTGQRYDRNSTVSNDAQDTWNNQ